MKRKAERTGRRAAKRATSRKAARRVTSRAKTTGAKRVAAKAEPAALRDALDALVEVGAQALGLPLDPAWTSGIKFNLQLILRHAALVDEFSLPDDAEPAPVYHA
jgi:hypothetical protein